MSLLMERKAHWGQWYRPTRKPRQIEDNEDMDYIGFFTDKDNKIIASNIEIKEP